MTSQAAPLSQGLMLLHSNHPEQLRDLCVQWVRRYPLAPLETETILVQSNGVAQWLRMALAADARPNLQGGCGIAAGLQFLLPAPFLWQAYRAVLGNERVPATSAFEKSQLIWRLLRLLPSILVQDIYAPLRQFLRHDADMRKCYQLAERIADLFDQYQVYRADWLSAWQAGQDVLINARGQTQSLTPADQWQPALWRALMADVNPTDTAQHPKQTVLHSRAGVHAEFLQLAQNWPHAHRPRGLPRRVMVVGISALPQQSLEVLNAISRWCEVLMCVHNPCEHYWADIIPDQALLRAAHFRQQRKVLQPAVLDDSNLHHYAHPLLAAWGKQGRDFIGMLDEHDSAHTRTTYAPRFADIQKKIDLFSSPITDQPRLLNQLQDDILALRPLTETRKTWPAVPAHDDSIQFHIAHSRQREVEILHDQLLAAFDADPTLQPQDVLVMVPNIDDYAPHIQAVFGLLEPHDKRTIPYTITDQGQGQTNPLVKVIEHLLNLPQSRLTLTEVLGWLEVSAVRKRFGISAEQVPLLKRWVQGAQIRWGLDTAHVLSLENHNHDGTAIPTDTPNPQRHFNTWLYGLERMMLGYATGDTGGAWQNIEPYDEIGGLEAAALGPLVQLIEALKNTWQTLSTDATPAQWCERLRKMLAQFFRAENTDEEWILQQLQQALEQWQTTCTEVGLDTPMPLTVVGPYWLDQLNSPDLKKRFFAGTVTFATLMPMRAIPFRQIALLGMNDGDFPRARIPMNFDLMARDYRPGDRSRREDDRYLFLEALLSARERLHISWVGRSAVTNAEMPPSVLIGQLRDHLAAGWTQAGTDLLNTLTTVHPLQPFSSVYFSDASRGSKLFTYAHEWRAQDGAATPCATPPVATTSPERLAPLERTEPLTLKDLSDFLAKPVEMFFRQRLKVYFQSAELEQEDHEPFALDGLDQWHIRDEMIQDFIKHINTQTTDQNLEAYFDTLSTRLRYRGQLPVGAVGTLQAQALAQPLTDLYAEYQKALTQWPTLVEREEVIHYQHPELGLTLSDWMSNIRTTDTQQRGRIVLESSSLVNQSGQYKCHKLIKHWVAHLAGHLSGQTMTTVVISPKGVVTLAPLDCRMAQQHINALMAAWHEGMMRPLPLAAETAFTYLGQVANGAEQPKAHSAAATTYEGTYNMLGEVKKSSYLQRAWPTYAALSASGEWVTLAQQLLEPLQSQVHKQKRHKTQNQVGANDE